MNSVLSQIFIIKILLMYHQQSMLCYFLKNQHLKISPILIFVTKFFTKYKDSYSYKYEIWGNLLEKKLIQKITINNNIFKSIILKKYKDLDYQTIDELIIYKYLIIDKQPKFTTDEIKEIIYGYNSNNIYSICEFNYLSNYFNIINLPNYIHMSYKENMNKIYNLAKYSKHTQYTSYHFDCLARITIKNLEKFIINLNNTDDLFILYKKIHKLKGVNQINIRKDLIQIILKNKGDKNLVTKIINKLKYEKAATVWCHIISSLFYKFDIKYNDDYKIVIKKGKFTKSIQILNMVKSKPILVTYRYNLDIVAGRLLDLERILNIYNQYKNKQNPQKEDYFIELP